MKHYVYMTRLEFKEVELKVMEKLKQRSLWLILMLVLLVFSLGCSNNNTQNKDTNSSYVVEDARGKKIEFDKPPSRIMSMYPGSDEILVNMVEPNRILALSKWAEDEQISNVMHMANKVKLRTEYNVEFIMKQQPDVFFTRQGTSADFISQLENVGVKVFVYPNAKTLDDVKEVHNIFGRVLKAEDKAKVLNQKIDDDVAKLLSEKHHVDAKILIFNSRGAMSTKDGLLGNSFKELGIENMADKYNLPPGTVLNKEQVVACNPDAIIIIDWSNDGFFRPGNIRVQEMYDDPSFQELKAIKNKKVILLPIKYISSGSIYLTASCYKFINILKS